MHQTFVDVSFAPSLQLVSLVREFVAQVYEHMLGSKDLVGRLSIATHEILENAIKYSVDGLTRVRVEWRPAPDGGRVLLTTWNRPRPADMEILKQNMEALGRAADPLAYYQELLQRASKRTDGSGLGLGRVLAEAEMSVRYALLDGQVCITAEGPVQGREDA